MDKKKREKNKKVLKDIYIFFSTFNNEEAEDAKLFYWKQGLTGLREGTNIVLKVRRTKGKRWIVTSWETERKRWSYVETVVKERERKGKRKWGMFEG